MNAMQGYGRPAVEVGPGAISNVRAPTLDDGLTLLVEVKCNVHDQLMRLRSAVDTLAGPQPRPVDDSVVEPGGSAINQLHRDARDLQRTVQDIGHEINRLLEAIGNRGEPAAPGR